MTSQHKNEIRIILTGKAGSGKSSLGNALLQKRIFKTGCISSTITNTTLRHTELINGKRITVIDSAGPCDTDGIIDKNTEIENCITLSLPGPHVILNVISIGRFTEEDFNFIKTFKKKFGRDVNRYYLLVLTHFDDYKRDNDIDVFNFESLKTNLSPEWKKLLYETFEDRVFPFDNTLCGNASVEQVSMLLETINDIISANNGTNYTNNDFKRAEQLIRQEKIIAELSLEIDASRIRDLEEKKNTEEFLKKKNNEREKVEKELQESQKRMKLETEQKRKELEKEKEQNRCRIAEEREQRRQEGVRRGVNIEETINGISQIITLAFNIYNMISR